MIKSVNFSGLPVVSSAIREALNTLEQDSGESWSSLMVRQLKEENPEVNALLLEMAQSSSDPKAVVLAGYKLYKLLELADAAEQKFWNE
jgi:hypothetical protein